MQIQRVFNPPLSTLQNFNTAQDLRVKQLALVFFSTLSIGLGILALSVGTMTANFIALASFSSAGILIWIISKIKQYDSPSELARYQKEAKSMTLDEIVTEHGWKNSLQYEIPKKELFEQKFLEAMESRSIRTIVKIYEKAEKLIEETKSPLRLPSGEIFHKKFIEETERLTACQIFESYDIEELNKYKMASSDLLESCKKYKALEENYKEDLKNEEVNFTNKCKEFLQQFSQVLDGTSANNPSETNWILQRKREVGHLKTISPISWNLTPPEKHTFDEPVQHLHTAYRDFYSGVTSAKKGYEHTLQKLEEGRLQRHQQINDEF